VTRFYELTAAGVASALTELLCRRDSGWKPKSAGGKTRTITGIAGRCGSNVGYFAIILDGDPIALIDGPTLDEQTALWDVDIPIPADIEAKCYFYSTSGTDNASLVLRVQE